VRDFLVIYLFVVPLVILWVVALWDNWRLPDRSVAAKIGWSATILVLPVIGAAVYYAFRPVPPPKGVIDGDGGGVAVVDELESLVAAHDRGDVSDEQFAAGKATLFEG
jgi:hypothetical protein